MASSYRNLKDDFACPHCEKATIIASNDEFEECIPDKMYIDYLLRGRDALLSAMLTRHPKLPASNELGPVGI